MSAARSVFRSAATRVTSATRLAGATKPMSRPACSPFRIPKLNSLPARIFRSPVEMSCCVETLLPYHTATASALMTSMLSVSCRSGWITEGGWLWLGCCGIHLRENSINLFVNELVRVAAPGGEPYHDGAHSYDQGLELNGIPFCKKCKCKT